MSRSGVAFSMFAAAVVVFAMALSVVEGCGASSSAGTTADGGAPGTGGSTGAGTGGFSSGAGGSGVGGSGVGTDAGAPVGGTTGGGSGGASGTGGASGCFVTIAQVTPPPTPTASVEAGPSAHVRVQATASGAVSMPVTWKWSVMLESSPAAIKTTTIDSAGAIVEFPVVAVGRYQVSARIDGQMSCSAGLLNIQTVVPGPTVYALRVSASDFPVQDTSVMLAASDPQKAVTVQLQAWVAADLTPKRSDMGGEPLASYVRITNPTSGLSVEADSTRGSVMTPVLPGQTYDVLIIPVESYAPNLLNGPPSQWPRPLQLDQGVPVNATTLDGGGNAVVGAKMVLRRGTLPSTLGVSNGVGVATLWARAGTRAMALYIVPPIGSGLPGAAVGAGDDPTTDPGIVLDSSAASLNLSMKWDRVTSAALTIHVLAPGGAATGAGARVQVTSKAPTGPVGTLTAQPAGGTPVTLRATGNTDIEVVTDATGTAAFTALPIGAYTMMIIPAPSTGTPTASSLAITTTTVTLAAGGLTRNVTLSTKSTLNGTLLPLSDSPGTQVIAIDHSVTAQGAVVSTTVAADGTYQLFVDPGRSYELLAQPLPGSARGRAVLSTGVSDATPTIAAATLPIAHPVHGTITGSTSSSIGGTLVQVFCAATSSRCLDATFPLAETVARADGSFDLLLPDPPSN